ncbi:MAG TPA: PfkB family carbohydrate kinase, partial [Candidatus Dormibacteraeota bacterium]|nr:PfkB family carbohydrate kinase [Candidatus Dormibacteraeota bacterium]
ALGARAWQPSVGLVTRRGDDFPKDLSQELASLGIAGAGIVAVPGPTVRNWVVYEANGDRHWIYRTPRERSVEIAVQAGDLPDAWLSARPAPFVHVAAMPIDAAEAVVDTVRRKAPEALISLDTHEDFVAAYRSRLRALAARVDAFLPSRSELADLVGYDDPMRAMNELSQLPTPIVVVKLGADGVLVWDRRRGELNAVPAAEGKVVDVTGAGDGFCGGFAAGLSLGDPPVKAAQRGVISAAYAVASFGSLGLSTIRPEEAAARLKAESPPRTLPAPAHDEVSAVPGADRGIASATDIMREEIAMIPQLIQTQLETLARPLSELASVLRHAEVANLFLTGCGDSMFAAAASALAFRRHSGLHVEAVEALELARYRIRYLPPASAVVCISFSGKVGRTIEAAIQARRFGHRVVALTGDVDSPLAREATHVLPLSVPTLGYSPGTSTYLALLLALLQLAVLWKETTGKGTLLEGTPELARRTLDLAAVPVEALANRVAERANIAFLGAGPNLASAAFGAAKLFEGPQMPATVTNLEEWAHGEYFITRMQDPVIVVAPTGASFDRAAEILSELAFIKADSILVSDAVPTIRPGTLIPLAPGLPEEFSPVLAALPLSLLAYHLTQARGQESFEFPSREAAREHYETIHRATVGEPA